MAVLLLLLALLFLLRYCMRLSLKFATIKINAHGEASGSLARCGGETARRRVGAWGLRGAKVKGYWHHQSFYLRC